LGESSPPQAVRSYLLAEPLSCFQHPVRPIWVGDVGWIYDEHQVPLRTNEDVTLAPGQLFPPSKPRSPPASVVLTVWLSMIPALGVGSHPTF
jgi:hypothetical protein